MSRRVTRKPSKLDKAWNAYDLAHKRWAAMEDSPQLPSENRRRFDRMVKALVKLRDAAKAELESV